jgi:hypothetical protein
VGHVRSDIPCELVVRHILGRARWVREVFELR